MTIPKEITHDLERLMLERIETLVEDHVDSMQRMKASMDEAAGSVATVLMSITAEFLAAVTLPKHDVNAGTLLTETIGRLRKRRADNVRSEVSR